MYSVEVDGGGHMGAISRSELLAVWLSKTWRKLDAEREHFGSVLWTLLSDTDSAEYVVDSD